MTEINYKGYRLTNLEIDRIIAKWCGWKIATDLKYPYLLNKNDGATLGLQQCVSEEHAWAVFCPKYSTDLNAIALAEKKLNQKQWNDLMERLKNLSNDGSFWSLKRILQFEPRQRAEALVSVIQNLETPETTLE